ncbi:hypothetical protein [Candidatus Ruthturnera calyptogenae]|nr:hypothetical protein [Candidatus Ruthturnera calyptogenae]
MGELNVDESKEEIMEVLKIIYQVLVAKFSHNPELRDKISKLN